MDADEVLRLCQIVGIAELFSDKDFSQALEAEIANEDEDLNFYNHFVYLPF